MSTGSKLGLAAAAVVMALFVWIALDLRDPQEGGLPAERAAPRMRPAENGQLPRAVEAEGRDAAARDRRAAIPARRAVDDAAAEPIDRQELAAGIDGEQLAAVVVSAPPAPNEGVAGSDSAPGDEADPERRGAAAQRQGDAGAAEGDSAESKRAFVPAPGDLKPDANLTGADLSMMQLEDVDLQGADLSKAKMHRTNMMGALLNEANLNGADMTHANMRRAELAETDMAQARLDNADLRGAKLTGAALTDASMVKTNVAGVNFYGADLTGADMREAILFGVDLRDSNLENVDFRGADMRDANLANADLTQAKNLTCTQLTSARGWQSAFRSEQLACGGPLPSVPETAEE